jgi:hypothetical protein
MTMTRSHTPLPIVVVVRGVVAAVEPGDSGFVIAGDDSAVIEAGEAPRHDVHVTWSRLEGDDQSNQARRCG